MPIIVESLKKDIEDQVKRFSNLESYSVFSNSIVNQILTDDRLTSLYNRKDVEGLMSEYIEKVADIQKLVNNPSNTDLDNVFNALEYIRFMHSFENYKETDLFLPLASLSQSSISQVFLGKGVCASQAKLMRDIVTGVETDFLTVEFRDKDEPMMITEEHDVTIIKLNDKLHYVDPTWYNGTVVSLVGSKQIAKYGNYEFETPVTTNEGILRARNEVAKKLIKLLKIDQISSDIINLNMTDIEKHCAIFTFIESKLNQEEIPVDFSNAHVEGYNVEVGKLLELFFIQNGINYNLTTHGEKSKTIYSVNLNSEEVDLYPIIMFDSKRKKLNQSLHYSTQNGQVEYICKRTPELFEEYKKAIYSGREIVKTIYKNSDSIISTENFKIV